MRMRLAAALIAAAAAVIATEGVRAEGPGAVRQSIPVERLGPPVRLADQCGATEYSCDDVGFPVCVYDASEQDYMCVPRNVIVCADSSDWDWWCNTGYYCCDPRSCCR